MALRQRTNFPTTVRKAAWTRSGEACEGVLPNGERCGCTTGLFIFDHIMTDFHGGRATLDNCQVLCRDCDRAKTAEDQAAIADTRRAYDAHRRLRAPRKPMAGSRFSPDKRGMDGVVRDRRTGAVRSRPASIHVGER